jgi:hypothetical protein
MTWSTSLNQIPGGAVIQELSRREAFDQAVRQRRPIVITSSKAARFHPSAQSCEHVTIEGFTEKVLVNGGKNGKYYSVGSRSKAEHRWPSLSDCRGWT